MHLQPKERLRFFLDYGECLWGDGGVCWPYEELLSPQTCVEVERFVCEFDAYYGLLPYEDFTVEDCRRFNRELRRVFALILADIKDTCIICNCQPELTEDEAVLEAWRESGGNFAKRWRESNYGVWQDKD